VLVGVQATQEVTALSFIETKNKYVYMEMGSRKYATLVLGKKKSIKQGNTMARSMSSAQMAAIQRPL
jgi:hypothetical protein